MDVVIDMLIIVLCCCNISLLRYVITLINARPAVVKSNQRNK